MRYDAILIQPLGGVMGSVVKPRMPTGLLSVASILHREGYRIKILDQALSGDWAKELCLALAGGPVCVGVTAMTSPQITHGLKASAIVKKMSRVPVVWGGVHPTILPESTVGHPLVDIVVPGEGEEAFFQVVSHLEKGLSLAGVPGIYYKKSGEVRKNPPGDFLDMDKLPMLPYELIRVEDYLFSDYYGDRIMDIESSRGCPFACSHCYNLLASQRRWRAKSPERVYEQIKHLHGRYQVRGIEFSDDSFFVSKERVLDICGLILKGGLDIRFAFQGADARFISRFSDQELAVLSAAGVRKLRFGLESGSPRILKLMNRSGDIEETLALNRRLARYPGLVPIYNVMCGYPTETKEDLRMTIDLVMKLLSEAPRAYVSPFFAFKSWPGTPIDRLSHASGFGHPSSLEEWGKYTWNDLVYDRKADGAARRAPLRTLLRKAMFCSFFVDNKIQETMDCGLLKKFLGHAYGPVARWRFKNDFFSFMPEERLFSAFRWLYGRVGSFFQERGLPTR